MKKNHLRQFFIFLAVIIPTLSCSIGLEFQASRDKKLISKLFFDLYCD